MMKHPRHYFPSRAFSLIELLMVVGIISILASIAVVNYQGSITRAKTSRALADMRTITIGIEAYHVDNNEYPPNPAIAEVPPPAVKGWLPGLNVIPIQITTPIAYLSTRPQDPFRHGAMANFYDNFEPQFTDQQPYFSYYKIISDKDWLRSIDPKHPLASRVVSLIAVDTSESGGVPFLNHGASKKYGEWVMWSAGPDLRLWRAKDDFVVPGDPLNALRPPRGHLPWGYSFDIPYDPTNGTTSFGNIIRTQKGDAQRLGISGPVVPGGGHDVHPGGGINPAGGGGGDGGTPKPGSHGTPKRGDRGASSRGSEGRAANGSEGGGSDYRSSEEGRQVEKFVRERLAVKSPPRRPLYSLLYNFHLRTFSFGLLLLGLLLLLLALLLYLSRKREEDRLAMESSSVNDSTLMETKGLKRFRRLYLAHSQVTDGGMMHLANLNKLQSLNLWQTGIGDAGVQQFSGLRSLNELVLMDTKITDAAIPWLLPLTSLDHLVLSGTAVSDASIESLSQMKSLKLLSLHRTRVSPNGILQLKEALPGCVIQNDYDEPDQEPKIMGEERVDTTADQTGKKE